MRKLQNAANIRGSPGQNTRNQGNLNSNAGTFLGHGAETKNGKPSFHQLE